jgi:hypothetical protein
MATPLVAKYPGGYVQGRLAEPKRTEPYLGSPLWLVSAVQFFLF